MKSLTLTTDDGRTATVKMEGNWDTALARLSAAAAMLRPEVLVTPCGTIEVLRDESMPRDAWDLRRAAR